MSDGTSEANNKPKRAPRKRASATSANRKAAASSSVSRKRAARKRATRTRTAKKEDTAPKQKIEQDSAPIEQVSESAAPKRKAPTTIAADQSMQRAVRIRAIVVAVLIVVGVGSSAIVGYTDQGTIDVNQVINERNDVIRSSGSEEALIPQQNVNPLPDGGLMSSGEPAPSSNPAPDTPSPAAVSSTDNSTATTSAATDEDAATSSPAGSVPMTREELSE